MTNANPRDTYLHIAAVVRHAVENQLPGYRKRLPTVSELADFHRVSRNTVHRALHLLKDENLIEPVQGVAWYVAGTVDQRTPDERIREMLVGAFRPGDRLPSEGKLCSQLGISRVTVRSALARLQGEGLISEASPQGRTILAISTDKEAS
jgi:DNA-binding GntR family transcriptional regulator